MLSVPTGGPAPFVLIHPNLLVRPHLVGVARIHTSRTDLALFVRGVVLSSVCGMLYSHLLAKRACKDSFCQVLIL